MEDKKKAPEKKIDQNGETQKEIPPANYDRSEEWVQEYIKQFGEEPTFF